MTRQNEIQPKRNTEQKCRLTGVSARHGGATNDLGGGNCQGLDGTICLNGKPGFDATRFDKRSTRGYEWSRMSKLAKAAKSAPATRIFVGHPAQTSEVRRLLADIGSVFNIFGQAVVFEVTDPVLADAEALAGDWRAVGQDLLRSAERQSRDE